MIELSVVIITKNQAWNIAQLIESVLAEVPCVASAEIILVDSASTDETVDLASRYSAKIFRLQASQRLSPAIGRYVGTKRAAGEYILFLDGDMQLVPGWLRQAICLMRNTSGLGAITGQVINLPVSAASEVAAPLEAACSRPPRQVRFGGGAAMYRHSVLEKVGTFNPNFYSDEEPELGFRVRRAGFRFLELDYPIVRHYSDDPVAISTPWGRRRRSFHLGPGQSSRFYLGSKLLLPWLIERPWGAASLACYGSGFGALLLSLISHRFIWFGLWCFGFCSLVGYVAFRKRSLRGGLVSAFFWLTLAEGFLKGLLIRPQPQEYFSANVETLKGSRSIDYRESTNPIFSAQTLD